MQLKEKMERSLPHVEDKILTIRRGSRTEGKDRSMDYSPGFKRADNAITFSEHVDMQLFQATASLN